MFTKLKFSQFPQTLVIAALFTMGALAQSPPPLLVQSFPTGQRPLGVAAFYSTTYGTAISAAVANFGDNSVSLYRIRQTNDVTQVIAEASAVISGIPSPYGVTVCGSGFMVTSPSANSISIIDAQAGRITATIKVGSQPYSAVCFGLGALVSNYGDNSLSLVDFTTLTVTKTIPNVPGSRSLHGIDDAGSDAGHNYNIWVAGTDANVLTLVNSASLAIAATIPFRGPTFVVASFPHHDRFSGVVPVVLVGSSSDNSVVTFTTIGLTIASTTSGIPTPQDIFLAETLGQFASTGPGNSVARISGTNVTFVPEIPGAAGLAGGVFFPRRSPDGPPVYFVLATSPDSNRLFLIQAQPASLSQFAVANGASFGTGQASPGALVSTFATTGVSQNFSATSVPLPKTLGGVTLKVGGSLNFNSSTGVWDYSPTGSIDAPLHFVGPNQVNFQVPPGINLGDSVPAQLTKPDGTTLLTTVRITATAPGLFSVLQNGQGQAAALNQDNSPNFGTNPAKRGSVIQIFATGAGETDPPLLPGEAASGTGNPLVYTRLIPTVTIGGIQANVQFSGMAPGYVGLWQINAEIPPNVTPGPTIPLTITAGGITSNTVTIAVE